MQIFEDTGKLLNKLQLRAHKVGHFSNIFPMHSAHEFKGLQVKISGAQFLGQTSEWGDRLAFNQPLVVATYRGRSDLRIGSLCRSMLITEPLVRRMKGVVSFYGSMRRRASSASGFATGCEFYAVP